MKSRDIAAAFDATDITATKEADCANLPVCGSPDWLAGPAPLVYCLPCCMHELGCTQEELALAVEFHLSIKAIRARLAKYGDPLDDPRSWRTPAVRLRRYARPRDDGMGGGSSD